MKRLTWRVNGEARIMLNGVEICGTIADRLAAYEDILGDEYDLDLVQKLIQAYREGRYIILKEPEQAGISRLRELAQADLEGRCFIGPFVAMIERSLSDGEMKPQRDQRFNGRYAVVYFDPKKWSSPLIDICGKPYYREEAEERMKELKAALRREQDEQDDY